MRRGDDIPSSTRRPPTVPIPSLQMVQRRERQPPTLRGEGHGSYFRKDFFMGERRMPLKVIFEPREGIEDEETGRLEPRELQDEDFAYKEDDDNDEDVEEKPRR